MSYSLEQISFGWGRQPLIENLSLEVEPGVMLGLLGPNGCGKSTLLNLICGNIQPSKGRVLLDGQGLSDYSELALARRRSLMAQSTQIGFAFSALEVTLLGRMPHVEWMETDEDIDIARQAMAACDVLHLQDRKYPTLSGGEQQRVQMSRALCQVWKEQREGQDSYLFLDEPTSSLDPAHQDQLMALGRDWAHHHGLGVVVVLHDINLASHYVDRLLVMKEGSIRALGTVEEVVTARMMEEVFGVGVDIVQHPQTQRPFYIRRA
jgi:iron complex transport system ATP-binding protein